MTDIKKQKIYSHHIFLFPFKWKKIFDSKSENNEKLKDFFDISIFDNIEKKGNWERKTFDLDNSFDKYNEYNYFYEYVREIMFDLSDKLTTKRTKNNSNLINHFEYKIVDNLFYNIKLTKKETKYSLLIDSIIINVYSTGTAVLSFHLKNNCYPSKEDVLAINKFGRRLYVPYFDLEDESIYTTNTDITKSAKVLKSTKENEIPDAIWISKKEKEIDNLYENFDKYTCSNHFEHGPFNLPQFIKGLFPDNFFIEHEALIESEHKVYLRPVLDDRMHVVSWYGNSDLVNSLDNIHESHYSYEKSDFWYNYIYVDTCPMHKNRFERQKLLAQQTYSRWVEWGTLFGISRYSLVMITKNFDETESYLVRHLQTMYYKMAELCLLQRATILSFSDEVVHVSNLIENDSISNKKAIEKIENLYKHYILFVNKIYFREITAQEQGIEMYDMMQKTMRISQHVKDLDNELEELNNFARMMADKKEAEQSKMHTFLASIFIPFMAIGGFLGMNSFPPYNELKTKLAHPIFYSILLILITTIVFGIAIKIWNKKKEKQAFLIFFFWGILLLAFIYKSV